MRWSKAWLTLLSLVAAIGVALAVVVPFLVQREMDRQVAHRLTAAAAGADAEVQLHARRWIDAVSHAALDEQLAEALDHASTGSANLDLLHVTAQERLRGFQQEWKAFMAFAVDAHGRVIARAGANEERWKDDLAAAQVVTEALKGFRLDDTWFDEGRLLKVVAAPVIARDRYAGAVLVALDLAADLAQPLADRLGAEVVFTVAGKAVGHSAKAPSVDAALAEASRRGATGEPVTLPGLDPSGALRVLLARPIPGSAAPGAQVIVVGELPRVTSLAAIGTRLQASPQLPLMQLLPVGIGLLAALLFGYFLVAREHGGPLERLARAVQSVARGDTLRVDDTGLDERLRGVARSMNAVLERTRGAVRMPSVAELASVGRELPGPAPTIAVPPPEPPAPPEPLPDTGHDSLHSFTPLPPPAPAASAPPPSTISLHPMTQTPAFGAPVAMPSASPFMSPSTPPPVSPPAPAPMPPSPMAFAPTGPSSGPLPPLALDRSGPHAAAPSPYASPSSGLLGGYPSLEPPALGSLDDYAAMPPLGDPRTSLSTSALGPAPTPSSGPLPGPISGPLPGPISGPLPGPISGPLPPVDPVDAEWQAVFQDFVDTRQRCGESVEGITYERFAAKLRSNRDQLMSRFTCKGVKFQVYVKDGKAALKATPVN